MLGRQIYMRPEHVAPQIHVVSLPEIPYNARHRSVRSVARCASSLASARAAVTSLQTSLLRRFLASLDANSGDIGVVLYSFPLSPAVRNLGPVFTLFDYVDNAFGFTDLPAHVKEEWIMTLRTVDLVTVTSPALAEQVAPYRSTGVHLVGNGVEFQRFAAAQDCARPRDLPSGKQIVAYVGSVYPWLDYELLAHVCKELSDVHIVLVGPVHPDSVSQVEGLKKIGNVSCLGSKPYVEIPAYLHHVDVGIIPFQKNELTHYVNPVKLYEYCAAGKPTVVTDFSVDVAQAREYIGVASSTNEFIALLKKALAEARDRSRIESLRTFARLHDWEAKTSSLIQLIRQCVAARRSRHA